MNNSVFTSIFVWFSKFLFPLKVCNNSQILQNHRGMARLPLPFRRAWSLKCYRNYRINSNNFRVKKTSLGSIFLWINLLNQVLENLFQKLLSLCMRSRGDPILQKKLMLVLTQLLLLIFEQVKYILWDKVFPNSRGYLLTYQGLRSTFKSRGQSVLNLLKWGQSVADSSKSMGAIESYSKIEGSFWPLAPL